MNEPITPATASANTAIVDALLRAAGLEVPAEETERLAALYPGLRRSVDRFYRVDAGDDVPAAVFEAGSVLAAGSGAQAGPVRSAKVHVA